jgi:hypothetical protein
VRLQPLGHLSITAKPKKAHASLRQNARIARLCAFSHLSITAKPKKAHAPLHQDARVACLCLHKDAREAHRAPSANFNHHCGRRRHYSHGLTADNPPEKERRAARSTAIVSRFG